jgi:hypothetical protein
MTCGGFYTTDCVDLNKERPEMRPFPRVVALSALLSCMGTSFAIEFDYFDMCLSKSGIHIACDRGGNPVECYFANIELMIEAKDQIRELMRALSEARQLPVEELKKPRYADYEMHPGKWSFANMIERYFNSMGNIGRISAADDEFYQALKTEEGERVLKFWHKCVEAALPSGTGD